MKIAFWIAVAGLALPAYSYLVYPALLFILSAFVQVGRDLRYLVRRSDRRSVTPRLPTVSIVIAAYNEEEVIRRTLECCLGLDYPSDRLEIIVGSDGSTDRTAAIVSEYAERGVQLLDFPERRGKVSVISDCVKSAAGEVVVFTDANTVLQPDSVRKLVRHFHNPGVGAVCGELRLVSAGSGVSQEGLYWRYEVALKTLESRLGAVLGANGGIYALRRELYPRVESDLITEDFVIPMRVRASGARVVYDPEAVAVEEAPVSAAAEFRRRVRIGAGNWQALRRCAGLLLPWKGFVAFAFWSHKVARWLSPWALACALAGSVVLVSSPSGGVLLGGQGAFYGAAGLGWLLERLRLPVGPLRLPFYFVAINAALALGLLRGAFGAQEVTWERTQREPFPARDAR